MTDFVVASGVADVWYAADGSSERVTQALLNMPVYAGEPRGEWVPVKLVDYMGWMRLSDLAEPIQKGFCKVGAQCATPLALVAVLTATHTPLYEEAEGEQYSGQAYLSTRLPVLDTTHPARVQVALPGERSAWINRADLEIRQPKEPYPRQTVETLRERGSWRGAREGDHASENIAQGVVPGAGQRLSHRFLRRCSRRWAFQAGLTRASAKARSWRRQNRGCPGRHKILKMLAAALSKADPRWYIPLAPRAYARVAFSGSLRTVHRRFGRRETSPGIGFSGSIQGLSRGGAAR